MPAAAEALRPHLRSEVRTLSFADWPPDGGDALAEAGSVAGAAADVRVLSAERAEVGGREGSRAEIAVGAEHVDARVQLPPGAQPRQRAGRDRGRARARRSARRRSPRVRGRSASRSFAARRSSSRTARCCINDCYNANPISMRAALDHLARGRRASGTAPRAVAVLGEMAELGPGGRRTSIARSARTRPRAGVGCS